MEKKGNVVVQGQYRSDKTGLLTSYPVLFLHSALKSQSQLKWGNDLGTCSFFWVPVAQPWGSWFQGFQNLSHIAHFHGGHG